MNISISYGQVLSKAALGQIDLYKKFIKQDNAILDLDPYVTPNIYTDFENEAEYHRFLGISQSQIKYGMQSMNSYYFRKYIDGSDRKTKDMTHGNYFHKCILEPHLIDNFIFDDDCIAEILEERPETKNVRATTEYKAWKKQQDKAGKILITREQKKDTEYMLESVYGHPLSKELLRGGIREKATLIYDEEYGVFRRCKYDILEPSGYECVVDVKKCQSIREDDFAKTIFNYGYYFQTFDYPRLASLKYNKKIKDFVFCAVESNPPYEVAFYKASPEMITAGQYMIHRLLGDIKESYENGRFDIANRGLKTINLPQFAEDKIDKFLSND